MLKSKFINVKWNPKNIKMYKEKGYIYTKVGDSVKIKIEDLAENSLELVEFKCDYCGEFYFRKWVYHNRNIKRSNIIEKDCCDNCIKEKTKESNQITYGLEWAQQTKEVQDKIKNTNLDRYGETSYLKTDKFKEQSKNTCQERYGTDNPNTLEEIKSKIKITNLYRYGSEYYSQTEEFRDKYNKTMMNNYGVLHSMQVEVFKNKAKETMMFNHGVEHALQNKDILNNMQNKLIDNYGVSNVSQINDIKIKKAETFFKNGTVATSRQQRYIHQLFGGGILNYSEDTPSLDIAFPDNKIYIEVNGSGHNLSVKMKQITEEEFSNKEKRRYYYLKRLGWKGIFINTPQDYLPYDEVLLNEYNKALEWFKSDEKYHSHYNINIGNKINDITYGKLRKIKEKDLKEVS